MQTEAGGGAFPAAAVGAAVGGMFAVDTAAGNRMILSIRQMQGRLDAQLPQIERLKEKKVKLGDLPEAQEISARDHLVASKIEGGEQSLEFVLHRFREALQDAEQALTIGMRNYAEFESRAEQGYLRIGNG